VTSSPKIALPVYVALTVKVTVPPPASKAVVLGVTVAVCPKAEKALNPINNATRRINLIFMAVSSLLYKIYRYKKCSGKY
jgi:hypothetical protein